MRFPFILNTYHFMESQLKELYVVTPIIPKEYVHKSTTNVFVPVLLYVSLYKSKVIIGLWANEHESKDVKTLWNVHFISNSNLINKRKTFFVQLFLSFFFSLDICWLRLDFESFTILGTGLTTESNGGFCTDTFKVTVSITNSTLMWKKRENWYV